MDSIGIDLHKRESQLCIVTDDGELIERRIATSRERFTVALCTRTPTRVLLEASTESEWVARHLESLGHTVIVADPGFAAIYATRSTRVKTDKRDARTLCDALQLGAYRAIHRASDAQQHLRARLVVRDALVRTRIRYAAIIKAFVRGEGLRIPSGDAEHTVAKLIALPLPVHVLETLAPVITLWAPLDTELRAADARMRWLLVETAWRILRSPNDELAGRKAWALQIAHRRGTRIAVVALARRVARIPCAMWRDDARCQALPVRAVAAKRRHARTLRRLPIIEVTDLGRGKRDAADGRT